MSKLAILSEYFKTRNNLKKNREALLKYQKKMINKHIALIKNISPFYLKFNSFEEIPIIEKKQYMDNFDNINTQNIKKEEALEFAVKCEKDRNFTPKINNITIGLSSGTSGIRGIFLVSKEEQDRWVGNIMAKIIPEFIFSKISIAFFLRANSNLYENVNSTTIKFVFYDLLQDLDLHIKSLNKQNPTILIAPPSMLLILSKKQKEGKLKIYPKKVISVAEVLYEQDRKIIAEAFGLKVIHQVYQAMEGFLGYTCSEGNIHLNEDIIMFEKEYIDKNKFYPIITDFNRKTNPIIRYRLNDVLTEKNIDCPCGCKFQVIDKIDGRSDDLIYDKNNIIFPDFINRAILNGTNENNEYKLIQHTDLSLDIYIENLNEEKIVGVTNNLKSLFAEMPILRFHNGVLFEKSEKKRRIIGIGEKNVQCKNIG